MVIGYAASISVGRDDINGYTSRPVAVFQRRPAILLVPRLRVHASPRCSRAGRRDMSLDSRHLVTRRRKRRDQVGPPRAGRAVDVAIGSGGRVMSGRCPRRCRTYVPPTGPSKAAGPGTPSDSPTRARLGTARRAHATARRTPGAGARARRLP